MKYIVGETYSVVDDSGVSRQGVYEGREEGAGVDFDVFLTTDRIDFQPGFVRVFLPVESQ